MNPLRQLIHDQDPAVARAARLLAFIKRRPSAPRSYTRILAEIRRRRRPRFVLRPLAVVVIVAILLGLSAVASARFRHVVVTSLTSLAHWIGDEGSRLGRKAPLHGARRADQEVAPPAAPPEVAPPTAGGVAASATGAALDGAATARAAAGTGANAPPLPRSAAIPTGAASNRAAAPRRGGAEAGGRLAHGDFDLGARSLSDAFLLLRNERNPAAAAVLLDRYLDAHGDDALLEEALVLRIEASAALHDAAQGRFAARYLERYPSGRFAAMATHIVRAR
jgi:hypothetical protein